MTGVTMSDDKKTVDQPTFVLATTPVAAPEVKKSRLTRKHLLIAVVSLLVVGLAVTCVLVAIRLVTDSNIQALQLQYSMTMKDKSNNNVQQNVSADVDANIVQYELTRDGHKTVILQDFDKGVQVSKVESDSGVKCYVTALNRSTAQEPSKVPTTAPTPDGNTKSAHVVYKVSETPIEDISYLGHRVSALCGNIPTFWAVPNCDDENSAADTTLTNATDTSSVGRAKRATVVDYYAGYPCVCGCCWIVCASFSSNTYSFSYNPITGEYTCTYHVYFIVRSIYLGGYPNYCYYGGRYCYYPWS